MPATSSFVFDLKLPLTPPTDDPTLQEQLIPIYRAINILGEQFVTNLAQLLADILKEGQNVDITPDLTIPEITISVPTEGIQDLVAAFVVAGQNVTVTYNDPAGTLTIAAPTEGIQDLVAAFVQEDWGIAIDYDDTAGTLTFRIKLHEHTPASATATGQKGMVTYDSNYLYICIANDTWRRIAHATW